MSSAITADTLPLGHPSGTDEEIFVSIYFKDMLQALFLGSHSTQGLTLTTYYAMAQSGKCSAKLLAYRDAESTWTKCRCKHSDFNLLYSWSF